MIKALTLTEPWATLCALSEKNVETRSWSTHYRGRIAIHAAKGYPKWARDLRYKDTFFRDALLFTDEDVIKGNLGHILCVRNLIAVIPTVEYLKKYRITDKEFNFGDYSGNRFAWVFDNTVRFFTPAIQAKGALGLWDWEEPA